eukprot:8257120-Alexandrium_andersonii.AAC.1
MGNRALWTALPRQRRRACGLSLASELLRQTPRTRYLAWRKAVARARGGCAVMAVRTLGQACASDYRCRGPGWVGSHSGGMGP